MPYLSIEDIWRRANVPVSVLIKLANADAYLPSLGLSRRDALWKIKALRDEALPLFVAADERANRLREEIDEPEVELKPMTAGRQVVEDYRHIGFTLRDHPVSFLREALSQRRTVTCQKANSSKDGTWLNAAGLVLVRQKPGSAKGVMFITIEDETAACNLVIWPSKYEEYRRIIFSAGMIAAQGRIQREGDLPCLRDIRPVVSNHYTCFDAGPKS
ncbi:MAG: hypothetical protein U1E36_05950 [Rickettsiales bacterium]